MWLIVGYGNSLHADDGFGIVVIEKLKETVSGLELEFLSGNQIVPEWAEPASRARGVVFVDASAELAPGELCCTKVARAGSYPIGDNSPTGSAFSHHYTPELLLELAFNLYGQAPPAWLYAVGAADLLLGESLSPAVNASVPLVLEQIVEFLNLVAARPANMPHQKIKP